MSYYILKTLDGDFDSIVEKTIDELAKEGFGVLTQIDVKATLKKKIDIDFRPYLILGACNPKLAHQAILGEPYIGTMLPCNVVVQKNENGKIDVSAVDPTASMQAVENAGLAKIAGEVRDKLKRVIAAI